MKAAKLPARVCFWLPDSHSVMRARVSASSAASARARVLPGRGIRSGRWLRCAG